MPDYGPYLRLPDLLSLQRPLAGSGAHDEMLFITTHQAFELWFKQLLVELCDARNRMFNGESYVPRKRLERAIAVHDVLIEQFDVLDTMAPQDFLEFRTALGRGNGGQSAQFWELALLSGAREHSELDRPWYSDEERAHLRRRSTEPTLWDGFLRVLAHASLPVGTREERFDTYHRIATDRERYHDLWDLMEAMIAHDQAWARWQERHLLCVQRQIGTRRGTGGTMGAAHLKAHRDIRFYPELWEFRTAL